MYFLKKKRIINPIKNFPKMHLIERIHFVGIGGSGMGGIAKILASEGYKISGSDIKLNSIIQELKKIGIKISLSHHPKNIKNSELVVVSNAIPPNNIEIICANKLNIPIISRSEMLAEIMRFRYSIAVLGSHGKSTTTAMIVSIYNQAGLDPTFINGGLIKSIGVYANIGKSYYLITEVDESDNSLLKFRPTAIVITNIEKEHLVNYDNNFENLKSKFLNFTNNLPFYGYVVMCIDDPVLRELKPLIKRRIITYGFSKDADFCIKDYKQKGILSNFYLYRKKKKIRIKINIPGYHNALNSAASIALATEEGIKNQHILKSIIKFKGVKDRFENLGFHSLYPINRSNGKIIVINDYGHHPTEIKYTIKTVRTGWPNKRLIMVFQPHRYSRTKDLYKEFIYVLSSVDVLLVLKIFSAGEKFIPGINSLYLCKDIRKYGKINPIYIKEEKKLLKILSLKLKDNDLLLMQGAGTINQIAKRFIRFIKNRNKFKKTKSIEI